MELNRRKWLQTSLLASSSAFLAPSAIAFSKISPSKISPPDYLKLNWNENPYGPSPKARQALQDSISIGNRYPDSTVALLKKKLGALYGLQSGNILITAGSTEALCLLGQHAGLINGEILTPWPSFPTLMMFGEKSGATVRQVDLDNGDSINLQRLKSSISDKTRLIFICNPNNPTSTELDRTDLEGFLRSVPSNILVCVDEAYIEFSRNGLDGSMVELVKDLPNLVVCRTFSKAHGLAGLRIGYAVSQEQNISALEERHTGLQLSAGIAPISAAMASLGDPNFIKMVVNKNAEGKLLLETALDRWGISYSKSSTNFVYIESAGFDSDIISKMKENGILITKWPDMKDHIRISIGTPDEMKQLVQTLGNYVI